MSQSQSATPVVQFVQRVVLFSIAAIALAATSAFAQLYPGARSHDHFEAGIFADYLSLERTRPHINFVGLGGRVFVGLSERGFEFLEGVAGGGGAVELLAEQRDDFDVHVRGDFLFGLRLSLGKRRAPYD